MKKVLTGSIMLLTVIIITAGCSSSPKYIVMDNFVVPDLAKIGLLQQVKCNGNCTDQINDPKTFTETLRSRLESLLQRPITILPPITETDKYGYYTTEKVAEIGRAAGVDFAIDAQIGSYINPSNAARSGAFAITALTAMLPIRIVSYTTPSVSAYIEVVRTADSKLVGKWSPSETGNNFARCTSMTEGFADTIYKKQFTAQ